MTTKQQAAKHTPGPWRWNTSRTAIYSGHPDDRGGFPISEQVIPFFRFDGDPRTESNARLIAAAPDLLAALQRIVAAYRESCGEVFGEDIRAAESAIAKATGE